MKNRALALIGCACLCGCFSHRVEMEPIEVKPIHVTVDVNVKVQRELDKFFDYEAPTEASDSGPQKKE